MLFQLARKMIASLFRDALSSKATKHNDIVLRYVYFSLQGKGKQKYLTDNYCRADSSALLPAAPLKVVLLWKDK